MSNLEDKPPFEVTVWEPHSLPPNLRSDEHPIFLFRVGTVEGQWYQNDLDYCILSCINREQGNGHFGILVDYFEESCRRDKLNLRFVEIMNERFLKHLIEKRGFVKKGADAIKYF